jgi:hypothetical protein
MNRRGFLKTLGLAAVGAAVLPEILEEPTSRTIFLPPRGGWAGAWFDTRNMRFKSIERFSSGWTDPRGTYGSAPDDGVALQTIAHPVGRDTYIVTRQQMEEYNLSEVSLERLVVEIRDSAKFGQRPIHIKPTHVRFTDPNAWYIKT